MKTTNNNQGENKIMAPRFMNKEQEIQWIRVQAQFLRLKKNQQVLKDLMDENDQIIDLLKKTL